MQTISSKKWLLAAALGLSLTTFAVSAFAECDDDQESLVGKSIAGAVSAKTSAIVPGQGKQMISLDTCEATGAGLIAQFKLNVIGSDGLYWVAGKATVKGKDVADLKFTSMSPNLAAASAKAGVKLASN